MKKMLSISFILMLSIGLSACGEDSKSPTENTSDKTTTDTFNEELAKEIQDEVKDLSQKFSDGNLSEEEAQKLMIEAMDNSDIIKNQLQLQKEGMPKLLKVLKATKDCLSDANNKSDAKDCEKRTLAMVKKFNIEELYGVDDIDTEDDDYEWNDAEKKEALAEMEEGILFMEKMIPCIEKAKVMTDLMKCSEDM